MDLHMFHTTSNSDDARLEQSRYVFATVQNQVAIRVQAWLRLVSNQVQLDLNRNKYWCADIATPSDHVQTCIVLPRQDLLLLQRMSAFCCIALQRNREHTFGHLADRRSIARILVQTCAQAPMVSVALCLALQLIKGETHMMSKRTIIDQHSKHIAHICHYLFQSKYFQYENRIRNPVMWFFEGGECRSKAFGSFQYLMLVLLFLPFVKCTLSADREQIVRTLIKGTGKSNTFA